MRKFVLVFIFGTILINCQNSSIQNDDSETNHNVSIMPSIEDTKWQFKIADDCINYFLFKKDGNSVYYSCESDDKSYGTYYVKNDTLYIHDFVTDTDRLLSPNQHEHKSHEAKYKLILEQGKLKHIESWSYSVSKEKWVNDNFQFDPNFLFEMVN